MPDLASLADNPWAALLQPPDWKQSVGMALANLGAGIAQAGASGQPWFQGIGPGAAMATNAMAQQRQQQLERGIQLMNAQELMQYRRAHEAVYDEQAKKAADAQAARAAFGNSIGLNVGPGDQQPQMGPGTGYTSRVAGDESGGNYGAVNPQSGAFGKYQFTPGTWADVATKHPELGLPFNIRQATPQQQDAAMQAFTADNAAGLRTAGFMPTPDNLYLAHRFGVNGAGTMLRADPNAPVASLYPAQWTAQNPDMQGKTVGQFRAGVQQRYSGGPAVAQGDTNANAPIATPGFPTQTPAPQMAQPPTLRQVPKPTLDTATLQSINNAVMTGQITPQQGRAEIEKQTNELWTQQKHDAEVQYQQAQENYRFNRGQAVKTDQWRPVTQQERAQLAPDVRGNVPLQVNTTTGELRAMPGSSDKDVRSYFQAPEVQKVIDALPPAERAAFDAYASQGDIKGAAALLKQGQTGIPPELQDLHGADFVSKLPQGDQNVVNGLLDGSLMATDLQKTRGGGDYNRYLMLAKQADPDWSPGESGARRAFETKFMVSGQGGQTMLAVNTAAQHMATYHNLMAALGNGNTPLANQALNYVRTQFGDAAASNVETAKAVLGTEIAKAVRGAGALNESEEKTYAQRLSSAASPQQAQGTLNVLSELMMGRAHSIEDMARSRGVADKTIQGYVSPRAREALDSIKNNPLGGKPTSAPPANRPPIASFGQGASATPSAPPANRPPITQFAASPAPAAPPTVPGYARPFTGLRDSLAPPMSLPLLPRPTP